MACSLKIWSDQRFLCIKKTKHQRAASKVYFSRYLEGMQEFYVEINDDLLKVSKSQKQFFLKLHCPKSDLNFWQISALGFKIGQIKRIKALYYI